MRISLLFLVLCIYSTRAALTPISFYDCERTKVCFKSTRSCTAETCDFAVSWKTVTVDNVKYAEIEISAATYLDNGYIIVGFSKDAALGNDGFVGCAADSPREPNIFAGYTEKNGDMQVVTGDKTLLVTKSDNDYLGAEYGNNRLTCRFRRRLTPEKLKYQLKDLQAGKKYYLFKANGAKTLDFSLDTPTSGSLIFSSQPVDLNVASFNQVRGSAPHDSSLAKLHGCLMIIGWILCSSIGIIMARYYKQMWPLTGIANESIWFNVHRTLQGTCFLFTILGAIFIFIMVGGYSDLEDLPYRAHPILGIIVLVLTIINPFINLCRCRPESKDRPWFNWFHFLIGTIAHCLAVPTIMIGMRLPAAGFHLSQLEYPQWVLIIFVIFQFCVEITLEIHGCFYYRRNKDKRHMYEMEMEEYQAALIANQAPITRPQPPKESGRGFKSFMIGLFVCVTFIVTIILIITIAVN